jgi:hypothetical protein
MIHNLVLRRESEKILRLIEKAEETFEVENEMRSHLAKYICILCSGFLENAIHYIYSDYIRSETASVPIISYSSISINKVQNPNSEKFREIAKSFNPDWAVELSEYLQDEERSAAINYIIRDRHKIAHGKDSDITLARIKEYHLKTVEVVKFVELQCGLIEA